MNIIQPLEINADVLIYFLLQVDPHRDRLGGVLVREARPARHIPQSVKDGRLDIALSELSIVILILISSSVDGDSAKKRERKKLVMYTVRASVLSGHKKNHCKDAAHHGETDLTR